jgi:threonine dehydrogenase-like Zn-dependent dehydrogenase
VVDDSPHSAVGCPVATVATVLISPTLIHPSITIIGSWVTSIEHMRELVNRLPYWNLRPEVIASDSFSLADAAAAYELTDAGRSGKIALIA